MNSRSFNLDRLERIGATFVQAGLGTISAEGLAEAFNVNSQTGKGLLIIGLTTIFAAIKTWAAKHIGDPNDASLLK